MMMNRNKLIYVDMDNVLCDYNSAEKQALEDNPDIKYPQSQPGFFENLEPINFAIDGVKVLDRKYEVYILTAPSVLNPLCYTEKRNWVEKHLGMSFVERMIISPNKGLNKGDYLIDDNIEGKGQETFEGELIHFGSDKFPSWADVVAYFYQ